MKSVLLLFFTLSSLFATAQQRVLRKSIDDNGRKLVVEIDLDRAGQSVQYRGRFDVTHLGKSEKQALLDHVLDSLQMPRHVDEVALLDEGTEEPERFYPAQISTSPAQPRLRRALAPVAPGTPGVATASTEANMPLPEQSPEPTEPLSQIVQDLRPEGKLRIYCEFKRNGEVWKVERTLDV
ncbi:MAG: hypothetical protein H7Y12_04035, partial [Sphingobacteriaceae bacterium]|nr:hypothetical protein [Cytophagaceae bacterium]